MNLVDLPIVLLNKILVLLGLTTWIQLVLTNSLFHRHLQKEKRIQNHRNVWISNSSTPSQINRRLHKIHAFDVQRVQVIINEYELFAKVMNAWLFHSFKTPFETPSSVSPSTSHTQLDNNRIKALSGNFESGFLERYLGSINLSTSSSSECKEMTTLPNLLPLTNLHFSYFRHNYQSHPPLQHLTKLSGLRMDFCGDSMLPDDIGSDQKDKSLFPNSLVELRMTSVPGRLMSYFFHSTSSFQRLEILHLTYIRMFSSVCELKGDIFPNLTHLLLGFQLRERDTVQEIAMSCRHLASKLTALELVLHEKHIFDNDSLFSLQSFRGFLRLRSILVRNELLHDNNEQPSQGIFEYHITSGWMKDCFPSLSPQGIRITTNHYLSDFYVQKSREEKTIIHVSPWYSADLHSYHTLDNDHIHPLPLFEFFDHFFCKMEESSLSMLSTSPTSSSTSSAQPQYQMSLCHVDIENVSRLTRFPNYKNYLEYIADSILKLQQQHPFVHYHCLCAFLFDNLRFNPLCDQFMIAYPKLCYRPSKE